LDVIRVNWSNYQKLNYVEKNKFINDLKSYVNNLSGIKTTFNIKETVRSKDLCQCGGIKTKSAIMCLDCRNNLPRKKRTEFRCNSCGEKCSNKNKICRKCYEKENRIKDRPNIQKLREEVMDIGYSATGRKYGVSDNTIRKWIK